MNTPTVITGIDLQPTYHFWHQDQEYFIWIWLSDGGPSISKACLSVPVSNGQGGFGPNNVLTESAYEQAVAKAGSVKDFMNNVFLPKVNAYLEEQTGEAPEFPSEGNNLEQFNWIVENGLQYSNGVVTLKDF